MESANSMDRAEIVLAEKSPAVPPRLLVAFVLSGFSALAYEIVSVRLLGELFGHTAYAIQVVLAVFFGGMAAGSYLSDRLDLNKYHAFRVYAAIEALLGIAGLLLPFAVRQATPLYDSFAPLALETGGALFYRLLLAIALLIVPTALMGATFPLLVRQQKRQSVTESGCAPLYAANTLGGAAGAWLTAFILMRLMAVYNTLIIAAGANFLAALLAFSQPKLAKPNATGSRYPSEETCSPSPLDEREAPSISRAFLAGLLFFSGFAAISLEVLWSRVLDQVLSGSVYSFATVLAVFLAGIVIGTAFYSRLQRRFERFKIFVVAQAALGIYVIASLFLITRIPSASEYLSNTLGVGFVGRGILAESFLSALMLLLPTTLMGISFPLLIDLARLAKSGSGLGKLVGANTLGAVIAPLLVGFLFLPQLGLLKSLLLVACISLAMAVITVFGTHLRARPAAIILAVMAAAGLFVISPRDIRIWGKPGERLIDYVEDPAASVSVVEYGDRQREKRLKVNNTYSLGGGRGIFTERRQGHLPMLLHPSPQRVLVLGVGTANTLGAVSLHNPDHLLAVELIQGVLQLAKKNFSETNYAVLENPAVRVINADALRAVRATPEKYDVIIGDLFHPWQAGVGALYSREHFTSARNALAPGGVFCQWLPLYQLSEENLKIVIRTVLSVFPEVSGWLGNFGSNTPVLGLIVSDQPVRLYWSRWEESLKSALLRDNLAQVYLDRPAELVGGYIGGRMELESFAGQGAYNTTGDPVIEFRAPDTLFDEELERHRRRLLTDLIHLNWTPQAPISFEGANDRPSDASIRSNVAAVRWMIQAFLELESGERGAALDAGLRSARIATEYDVPGAVLAELAWDSYQQLPGKAEQAFRAALTLQPDNVNARTGLGAALLFQNRLDEAIGEFEKALKQNPSWAEAREGLEKAKRLKQP